MPLLDSQDYHPNWIHKNAHLNTMLPYLLGPKSTVHFERRRINTPDHDFLDLDFSKVGSNKICILSHGLEGSSKSQYIISASNNFNRAGYDTLAWNFRSCSEEMNKKLRMYHSGFTDDLRHVVESIKVDYDEIVLLGFSLGANISLKYAGEEQDQIDPRVKAVIGISVPCDLAACSNHFSRLENYLYEKRFLVKLSRKVWIKSEQFPEQVDPARLKKVRNLKDFDEYFTAPIHGFKNAEDYYEKSSCLPYLDKIALPSLIINALDDPFLHEKCFPFDLADQSDRLHLLSPQYGGHVGFGGMPRKMRWSDMKAIDFAKLYSDLPASNG